LHHVAPLVGQLPLGEERAIVELKARGLLGDVDVDRGPPANRAPIVSASCPANIDLLKGPGTGIECSMNVGARVSLLKITRSSGGL
jgi:hypothetical protein